MLFRWNFNLTGLCLYFGFQDFWHQQPGFRENVLDILRLVYVDDLLLGFSADLLCNIHPHCLECRT